jgi:hypothetical protein
MVQWGWIMGYAALDSPVDVESQWWRTTMMMRSNDTILSDVYVMVHLSLRHVDAMMMMIMDDDEWRRRRMAQRIMVEMVQQMNRMVKERTLVQLVTMVLIMALFDTLRMTTTTMMVYRCH